MYRSESSQFCNGPDDRRKPRVIPDILRHQGIEFQGMGGSVILRGISACCATHSERPPYHGMGMILIFQGL